MTRAQADSELQPTIDRIRKLLRLAQSTNPHEASSAAATAQQLMSKYRLGMDDVIEDAYEILEVRPNPFTAELAKLVATWVGAQMVVNKRGVLGLLGGPERVKRGLAVYIGLAGLAAQQSQARSWVSASEAELYRVCWWLGFLEGVGKRLGKPLTPVAEQVSGLQPPKVVLEAADAAADLKEELLDQGESFTQAAADIERVRQQAYTAGWSAGCTADVGAPLQKQIGG